MPEQWVLLVLLGVACGFLGGLLGLGGGILMVPALVLLAYPQKEAQGMALAVMVPMAIVGAIRYKMHPEIDFQLPVVAMLAVGSVCGVLGGAWLAAKLDATILRRLFACIMIIAALKLMLSSPVKSGDQTRTQSIDEQPDPSAE